MSNQAERTIRLLICDDQAIVCEGLRAILEPVPNIEVLGVANNGVDALELTRALQPDLVFMDLKMPRMNGIQATKGIREQFPDVRVLVLTTYDDDEWVIDAIRYGAAGYLLKDAPQEDLLKAILETKMPSSCGVNCKPRASTAALFSSGAGWNNGVSDRRRPHPVPIAPLWLRRLRAEQSPYDHLLYPHTSNWHGY